MLVKFTKSISGGEKRGFVVGREFDWPMALIRRFRADYGAEVLVSVGLGADRSNRLTARRIMRDGEKLERQDRLRAAGLFVEVSDEDRSAALAEATAAAQGGDDDGPDTEIVSTPPSALGDVEPGTERPLVYRRPRKKPELEATPAG